MTVAEFDRKTIMQDGRNILLVNDAYKLEVMDLALSPDYTGLSELEKGEIDVICSIGPYGHVSLQEVLAPGYADAEIKHMLIGYHFVILFINPEEVKA